MAWAWHGMASVNQTWPHCVNQMGKTHSKPLAVRHGRGATWARHAVCELAFTGHKTLGGCLYLIGLIDSPLCRRCRAEEETSAHVFCECEALASLRHAYLGSFFLDPEDVGSLSLVTIWNFSKVTGLTWLGIRLWGTKGLSKGLGASGPKVLEPKH
jgi:hypothetical protein